MLGAPRQAVAGFRIGQIVRTAARMGFEIEKSRLLALHRPDQSNKQGVFRHVRKIAGMKAMAVVHGVRS
jgi:hypothetical protein